ncbi:hypothetical protein HJG54_22720 [Leptolyngbya sp. NK1-12]|uniref:Uncharacterized protein n=1 Tax=Leptolyngbya sp. NK1-12 TaxID=2547451 RepID=A0AA96WMY1_9CYAN|nr:hypothetical protein [Leptolyngbya sp. NK1-12]WNZ25386.1 hypothetical protein HJG54_22720 [Leptolyngbya sp. NK1-12]
MTDDLKLKIYPAVIAILGLSLVALLMSRLEIQVASDVPPADLVPLRERSPSPVPPAPQPSPTASPSPTPKAETPIPSPSPSVIAPAPAAPSEGGLRVSNRTTFPVRIALLHQATAADVPPEQVTYEQPVHWDFAPEEGEAKGLILSLPEGSLRLKAGDVLVAFAQDGSRRYWGPYVVGRTPAPNWSAAEKEWSLILQP